MTDHDSSGEPEEVPLVVRRKRSGPPRPPDPRDTSTQQRDSVDSSATRPEPRPEPRKGSPRPTPARPMQHRPQLTTGRHTTGKGEQASLHDDGDYVVLPPDRSRVTRVLTLIGCLVLLLGLLSGAVLLWASRQMNPSGPQGEVIESLSIPKGSSSSAIAEILADHDVISSSRLFKYYIGWKDAGPWVAGNYIDFHKSSSFDEAIDVLDQGPIASAAKVVRVTEGVRLSDALKSIADQMGTVSVEQLQSALDSGKIKSSYKPDEVANWEGFLFPDTYQFDEESTAEVILQTMATKMDTVLDDLGYDRAEALAGRSAYDLVTIASLIEKEAGTPAEERGKISRVISNRLDNDESLGIDAALLYGLGRSSGELTKSDLSQETPYNTRIVKGLPPTPIALPGKASLEAAIDPPQGEWKYYVLTSNDPPTHFFTDSYKEFTREKADAQRRGVF